MSNIYVISDTHFGHTNIVRGVSRWEDKSDCRPFDTVEAHDRAIVQAWNATVEDDDVVYHLGDVAFKESHLHIVSALKGRKRLILGNHDHYSMELFRDVGFEAIYGWRDLGRDVTLTHGPLHPDHVDHRVNIHGHIHTRPAPKGPYANVSIEQLDGYRPITLEEAIQMAERNR